MAFDADRLDDSPGFIRRTPVAPRREPYGSAVAFRSRAFRLVKKSGGTRDSDVLTRLLVAGLLGAVVFVGLALAERAQPMLADYRRHQIEATEEQCTAINESGEQEYGELSKCMSRLAHLQATRRE